VQRPAYDAVAVQLNALIAQLGNQRIPNLGGRSAIFVGDPKRLPVFYAKTRAGRQRSHIG